MTRCVSHIFIMIAWMLASALPSTAQIDMTKVDECMTGRVATGGAPDTCIFEALAECDAISPETPAVATLCFTEDEQAFNAGIAGVMKRLAGVAPEAFMAAARIETKYDVLSARLQCSRIEELSRAVGRASGDEIVVQDARCKANAAGLTYARLFLRATTLE